MAGTVKPRPSLPPVVPGEVAPKPSPVQRRQFVKILISGVTDVTDHRPEWPYNSAQNILRQRIEPLPSWQGFRLFGP